MHVHWLLNLLNLVLLNYAAIFVSTSIYAHSIVLEYTVCSIYEVVTAVAPANIAVTYSQHIMTAVSITLTKCRVYNISHCHGN